MLSGINWQSVAAGLGLYIALSLLVAQIIDRTVRFALAAATGHESAKSIEDFLINSLSQIYIPIIKSELWDEDDSKKDRRFTICLLYTSDAADE